jgi:hypothetical protein
MIKQFNKISIADTVIGKAFETKCNPTPEVTNMFRIKMQYRWVALIVALVASFGFATTAQADYQVSPVQFSQGKFNVTLTDSAVSQSSGSANGKIVLRDVMIRKGIKTTAGNCKNVKTGYNSGESADGKLFYFKDHDMRVCKNPNSPTGWVKVGGGYTGRKCYNPVKLVGKPKGNVVQKSRVELVKSFSYKATATAKALATTTGTATATCKTDFSSATSTFTASATATSSATATAYGKTRSSALSTAQANAVGAYGSDSKYSSERVKVASKAEANAKVAIDGQASAYCSSVAPPPPPPNVCTPPSTGTYPDCVPPPPVNPTCTDLVSTNTGNTPAVSAYRFKVTYNAADKTFASATFDFGDGTKQTVMSDSVDKNYVNKRSTFVVSASVKFTDGTIVSGAQCSKSISIAKVCDQGSIPSDDGQTCVKSGGTASPPPPTAPGPPPPPADTTTSKCYSETTGQPVTPGANGACPPGSHGA